MPHYKKYLVSSGSIRNRKRKFRFERTAPFVFRNGYILFIEINSGAGNSNEL